MTTFESPKRGEVCDHCGKPAVSVMVDHEEGLEPVRQPECQEHADPEEE